MYLFELMFLVLFLFLFFFVLMLSMKALTVWITTNCGKFLKGWDYQTTLPAS